MKLKFFLQLKEKIKTADKKIVFVSITTTLLLSFPISTSAGVLDVLGGLSFGIPSVFIGLTLLVLGSITSFLVYFASAILNWVLKGDFINLSYTNPENNELIKIGLDITMPLANMLLVVFLVVISLSIALRLGEYGSKKIFVKLIIVALLINFTTVFTGLVVDAANIFINFFAQAINGGEGIFNRLSNEWQSISAPLSSNPTKLLKITEQISLLSQMAIILFMNIALFLVLIAWAGIFAFRYIAIWLLVILSPIAFVCTILPSTQRLWRKWLDNFIQWVVVGIPAIFFLYLADQFAIINPVKEPQGTIGAAILPHLFVLAVYLFGMAFTAGTLPAAATTIKSSVTGAMKTAGIYFGVKTWRYLDEKGGIRERVGWLLQGKPESERRTTGVGGFTDKYLYGKGLLNIPVVGRGLNVLLPEAVKSFPERRIKVDEAIEELKKLPSPELGHRIKTGEFYGSRKVAALKILSERGDFQAFWSPFIKQYASEIAKFRAKHPEITTDEEALGYSLSEQEKQEFKGINAFQQKTAQSLQLALQTGYISDLLRGDPRLARIAFGRVKGYMASDLTASGFSGNLEGVVAKSVSESRHPHISRWEKEVLEDKNVVQELLKRERSIFEGAIPTIKRGRDTMLQTLKKILEDFAGEQLDTEEKIEKAWSGFIADPQRKKSYASFIGYINTDRAIQQGWSRKTGHQRLITEPDGKQRREDIIIPNFLESSPPPKSQSPESQPSQQTTPRQRPPSVAGYTPPRQPPKITQRGFFGRFFSK